MANDSSPLSSRPTTKPLWPYALLLLIATLIAYHPAWHGQPLWDDDAHLTRPQLVSLEGLSRIWFEPGATQQYYPLVHSVFWLEQKLWGYSPLGYHLVSILLHVTSSILLLMILRRLKIPGAEIAAGIFALHPIEVESVAWISELKNTLSGVFYFLAAWFYLRFDDSRARKFYFTALVLFVAGLLCKSVIASLPAAMLVVFWWHRGRILWKKDAVPLIPFFIVGAAMGLVTAEMERKFIIGGEGEGYTFNILERFLIAGRAFWFYIGKLFWPGELIFSYPRWNIDHRIWWQYLFPLAGLAVLGFAWAWRKRHRGPLAALLFFGGTLFPALGFVNVYPFIYSFVADHFQYLAGVGIIVLVSAALGQLLNQKHRWQEYVVRFLIAILLTACAALTWRQCQIYSDAEILYTDTIRKNPGSWMAYNNLGNIFVSQGNPDMGIANFEKVLALNPHYAKAENNIGEAYVQKRQLDKAAIHFQKALELRPDLPEAHNNLGNLLRAGNVEAAVEHYKKAVAINPDYAAAHNNLANAYYQKGLMDDAIAEYRKAIYSRPDMAEIYNNLGNALLQKGNADEAIANYETALRLQPNHVKALNNLAWLLATSPDASMRDGTRALELAGKANQLSGGEDPGILGTLAAAYAETSRFPEAIETTRKAMQLASAAGNTQLVNLLRRELEFYQARTPFHQ